jgi:hypothetical protein
MNTIIDIFGNIRNNFKEFVTTCLFISFITFLIYLSFAVYAYSTQVAVYSQDIPRGMICIKDAVPNGYICSADQQIPWYLSSEGVLAHVE